MNKPIELPPLYHFPNFVNSPFHPDDTKSFTLLLPLTLCNLYLSIVDDNQVYIPYFKSSFKSLHSIMK